MSKLSFPRQDILEKDKNPEWCKKHLDYAEQLLHHNSGKIGKMNRLYNGYNGKTETDSINYLVSTYGRKNKAKYIDYRLSKTKVDMLHGEWLKSPLNATVRTINSEAIAEKMQRYDTLLGAAHAKDTLEKLQVEAGVDVMEGMPIPEQKDPSAWGKLAFKDKNESIMQLILKEQIEQLDMVSKLGMNFQDGEISARAFGQVIVNDLVGDVDYDPIDPRDAIYEEFDKDPFLEKSFLMGRRKKMPIHQILTTYNLTDTQRNHLEEIRNKQSEYADNATYKNAYSYVDGEFVVDVLHIEWKSVRPKYTKISPKTKPQLEYDSSTTTYETDLNEDEYESNQKWYDKKAAKGEFEVRTEWEEQVWEATRIGHDIDVNCRRKPFLMRDEDTGKVLGFSYTGMVFNMVDGEAISLQEICENFNNLFNVVMYQILKEINKAKGKVIVYDRAGLPKKTTVKNVLYQALNDSFIDIDSSAAGNMSGKDLQINQIFKEIDLGLSNSFPSLIAMKQDIMQTLDRMTGINENREGQIAASSTATNAMSSIEASRTITEPFFFAMTMFSEKVLMKLVETTKLVWGLYKPERARMVLGDEKFGFLEATRDIAFASYGVSLENARQMEMLRERMRYYGEISLNAKELRPIDMLNFELQETVADAKAVIKKSWEDIQKMRQMELDKKLMADNENATMQQETTLQISRENREDMQAANIDEIREKGRVDLILENARQKGQMTLDQNKIEQTETGF